VLTKSHLAINNTNTSHFEVNRLARKARLNRVFSRSNRVRFYLKRLKRVGSKLVPKLISATADTDSLAIDSSQILKKSLAFSTAILLFASLNVNSFGGDHFAAASMEASMPMGGIIISDNDGYLTKISPQTGASDRSQMTDKATHTVASGETLSQIATQYGVSSQTIVWENNLRNKNSLRTGQVLSIPPVDGVTHNVKKGQTLDTVAKLYGVDAKLITQQNRLDSAYLFTGQELIIPGGKRIIPAKPRIIAQNTREGISRASSPARTSTYKATNSAPAVNLARSNAAPVGGKSFIYPTRGKITQYFHRGHYAYDIADVSRPPIWAAATGTVIKVSTGTWGGGYGNHVIIDHGNGYKTLYAHMGHVNVKKGQHINQGDVVGQMSNTGRVRGRTGIHLHFEIRKNGVKVNPGKYF